MCFHSATNQFDQNVDISIAERSSIASYWALISKQDTYFFVHLSFSRASRSCVNVLCFWQIIEISAYFARRKQSKNYVTSQTRANLIVSRNDNKELIKFIADASNSSFEFDVSKTFAASLEYDQIVVNEQIQQSFRSGSRSHWYILETAWSRIWKTLCKIDNEMIKLLLSSANVINSWIKRIYLSMTRLLLLISEARIAWRVLSAFFSLLFEMFVMMYFDFLTLKFWKWSFKTHFFVSKQFR